MKELPTDDPLFGQGHDPRRRRKIHDAYLYVSEEAGRLQAPRRFLQRPRHHPGKPKRSVAQDGGCRACSG